MDNCRHGVDARNPCETCILSEQIEEVEALLVKEKALRIQAEKDRDNVDLKVKEAVEQALRMLSGCYDKYQEEIRVLSMVAYTARSVLATWDAPLGSPKGSYSSRMRPPMDALRAALTKVPE